LYEKKKKYAHQELSQPEKTASPRSQNVEREREHEFIRESISNKTSQTINDIENHWGYRLGTVSGNIICHWDFKLGSRVHQPHIFPKSCMQKHINNKT
jgi:hypothetical protein